MNTPPPKQSDEIPTLQDFTQKPILVGADVVSLYPNLKKEVSGEMIYRATVESGIEFKGVNYDMLSVYLFLVMGIS